MARLFHVRPAGPAGDSGDIRLVDSKRVSERLLCGSQGKAHANRQHEDDA